MRRLAGWKNGSMYCDDSITNVDVLDSGISTTIPMDTNENGAKCPEDKSNSPDHINSTMIPVAASDNAVHVIAHGSVIQNETRTSNKSFHKKN